MNEDAAFSAADHAHMGRALQLAERGLYSTPPNPAFSYWLLAPELDGQNREDVLAAVRSSCTPTEANRYDIV